MAQNWDQNNIGGKGSESFQTSSERLFKVIPLSKDSKRVKKWRKNKIKIDATGKKDAHGDEKLVFFLLDHSLADQ